MRQTSSRATARHAFTLMELLLVMAILVILLGLVAPRFMGTQKKANLNAAKSQIGLFKPALDMYATDLNVYPTTEQGLQALIEVPGEIENPKKWTGPYVDSVPKDPWGHDYQYGYPPTNNKKDFPDIWSMGPDGEDSTEDDVNNWGSEEDDKAQAPA